MCLPLKMYCGPECEVAVYKKRKEFDFEDITFQMIDVGGISSLQCFRSLHYLDALIAPPGQRSERRKWIHCFEGITAVIFCGNERIRSDVTRRRYHGMVHLLQSLLSLTGSAQLLRQQNRMKESLLLWEEICNSRWFSNTTFILFMNKMDIFAEKIRRIDLSVLFPDYEGSCCHH